MSTPDDTTARLEYLRGELHAERISMGELIELQGYGEDGRIPADDVELREAAGLPEFPDEPPERQFVDDPGPDLRAIQHEAWRMK